MHGSGDCCQLGEELGGVAQTRPEVVLLGRYGRGHGEVFPSKPQRWFEACGLVGLVLQRELAGRRGDHCFDAGFSTAIRIPAGVAVLWPTVQGRSFSGLRTAQMCLIRSPATSNAATITVTPPC